MSHLDRLRAPTNQYEPKSNATITIAGANPRVSECMLRRRNGQKGGATMTFVHTVLLYMRNYTDFQSSKQHCDGQHSKHRYGRMVSRVAQCGTLQHLYIVSIKEYVVFVVKQCTLQLVWTIQHCNFGFRTCSYSRQQCNGTPE